MTVRTDIALSLGWMNPAGLPVSVAMPDFKRGSDAISAELVRRCQAGDTGATRELFELLIDDVHRILNRLLARDVDHDDLCQEVLLALHRGIRRFRFESSFRTWMYSVCVHIAYRHRWQSRRARIIDLPATPPATPEESLLLREESVAVQRALARMKPKKSTVYVLLELEGLPVAEVAAAVGAPVATVHTRLHHARRELREALARHQAKEDKHHG